MGEYFKLVSDNDGHWWIVPEDTVEDMLQHIADEYDEVEEPFPMPERAVAVDGPEAVKFATYSIK